MNYHRIVLLLSIVSFAPAHAAEPASADTAQNAGIQSLGFTSQFRTRFGRNFDSSQLPKAVSVFRLDPAYLLGRDRYSGVSRVVQNFSIRDDQLTIDPDEWIRMARQIARPLAGSDIAEGLSISPADTRVALIHPITYLPGDGRVYGRHVGQYTELQSADRQPVSLVFFDRPCRVSGQVELMNKTRDPMPVEIDVPGPGFYFLRQAELPGRGRSLVIDAQMTQFVFVSVF